MFGRLKSMSVHSLQEMLVPDENSLFCIVKAPALAPANPHFAHQISPRAGQTHNASLFGV